MAKVIKTKKAKKVGKVKSAPSKKPVTSVKITVKGRKTVVKLATRKKKITTSKAKISKSVISKAANSTPSSPLIAKKTEKLDFVAGDFVVYPAHGVGQVEGVEVQMISGIKVTLYAISFEKDRMRLKLPVTKVKASGLRKLSSKDRLKDALATLQGRSQVRRIMWSRRAQEYEAKINSGDPVSIAEVLRDLKKSGDQGEQSYSERQIYQAALARLAREVAAIEKIDEKKATEKLESVLSSIA